MLCLIAYYLSAVNRDYRSSPVLLALAFSWAGDVLLLFNHAEIYFISGLLAFLIAHFFYILSYRQHRREDISHALMGVQRFRFSLPVILAGTGLISVLYNHLGDLKFPVLLYTVVLILMVLNALFRFGRTTPASFWMLLSGALLFMISDSMIAINKFLVPIGNGGFWIMATYVAAQWLIVEGLVRHR